MKTPCGLEYTEVTLHGKKVKIKPCKMLTDTDVYYGPLIPADCETCKYNEEKRDEDL